MAVPARKKQNPRQTFKQKQKEMVQMPFFSGPLPSPN